MADPFGPLKALVDLAGPFLIPVALFVLGLAGYAALLALGRVGLLDGETVAGRPDGLDADGADVGGTDAEGSRADATDADGPGPGGTDVEGSDDEEVDDEASDGLDADGSDDRPRRV